MNEAVDKKPKGQKPKPGNRLWREIAGWGLIVLGVAGCILPVLPGIPFLIGGLAILAHDYVWARRAKTRAKHYARKAKRKISGGTSSATPES